MRDITLTADAWTDTVEWLGVKFDLNVSKLSPFEKAQLTLLARIARALEQRP